MLNKIKEILNIEKETAYQIYSDIVNPISNTTEKIKDTVTEVAQQVTANILPEKELCVEGKDELCIEIEKKIILYIKEKELPKKLNTHLINIKDILIKINFSQLAIDEKFSLKQEFNQEIFNLIDNYSTLPKAQAVSVVLSNGKTAKDNLISKVYEYQLKLQKTQELQYSKNSESFLKPSDEFEIYSTKQKDFYD